MTHCRLLTSMLLLVSLAACDQKPTPIGGFDDDGCDPTAGDDGVHLDVAAPPTDDGIAIDCSFAFGGMTQTVRFEANVESEPLVVGGDLNVTANLFEDDFEGRSFSISIYDVAGTVGNVALYQMQSGTRPVNEFAGDHGFTGLNWVQDPATGENLQYACFSRDPEDPIAGWDE